MPPWLHAVNAAALATIAAVIAAFLNFAIYAVVVNLVTAPLVGAIWFPTVSALALAVCHVWRGSAKDRIDAALAAQGGRRGRIPTRAGGRS